MLEFAHVQSSSERPVLVVTMKTGIRERCPNHSMQRMRASRLGQSQFERPRRLARTADAGRSLTNL